MKCTVVIFSNNERGEDAYYAFVIFFTQNAHDFYFQVFLKCETPNQRQIELLDNKNENAVH